MSGNRKNSALGFRLPAIILALLFPAAVVILAHQVAKFPEDPALMDPREMYDNFAFALALGFGMPWPRLTGAGLLLGVAWAGYRIGAWGGKWLGALLERSRGSKTD